jgi:hypothetical protein
MLFTKDDDDYEEKNECGIHRARALKRERERPRNSRRNRVGNMFSICFVFESGER